MSGVLSGALTIPNDEKHSLGYWCTLVFEAMRRIGFGFTSATYAPENRGTFYIWPIDAAQEETVAIGVSFRTMWDHLSKTTDPIVLEFWPWTGVPYLLQVVIRPSASNEVQAMLQLPVESLPVIEDDKTDNWLAESKRRLRTWLGGLQEMTELCEPKSVQLEWERWGVRYWVGSVNLSSDMGSAPHENSSYFALRRDVCQVPLTRNVSLHLLNPFPVPYAQKWTYVSLQSDDDKSHAAPPMIEH